MSPQAAITGLAGEAAPRVAIAFAGAFAPVHSRRAKARMFAQVSLGPPIRPTSPIPSRCTFDAASVSCYPHPRSQCTRDNPGGLDLSSADDAERVGGPQSPADPAPGDHL